MAAVDLRTVASRNTDTLSLPEEGHRVETSTAVKSWSELNGRTWLRTQEEYQAHFSKNVKVKLIEPLMDR